MPVIPIITTLSTFVTGVKGISDALGGGSQSSASGAADKMADIEQERWDTYKEVYLPNEKKLAAEAERGVDADVEAGRASADVTQAFSKAKEMEVRQLGRYGINPNSGRFVGSNRKSTIDQSVADASAQTRGRRYAKEATFAKRLQVANVGKGIPGSVSAGLYRSGALSSNLEGRSAADAAAGARALGGLAEQYGSGSGGDTDQLGPDVGLEDYGNDTDDMTPDYDDEYAHGGMVRGPGNGTSDDVPINASNGEYVIPAGIVKKKGTDFFDKMLDDDQGHGMRRH